MHLDVEVNLTGDLSWLAEKYKVVLGAVVRATQQLQDADLRKIIPGRPHSFGEHLLHILSFAELAYTSHRRGSMSTDDMLHATEKTKMITTTSGISHYGEQVCQDIVAFLLGRDHAALSLVIHSHYGGEVTVQETLGVILGHSTHHLKQAYWFMRTHLGMRLERPATEADLKDIATPRELF